MNDDLSVIDDDQIENTWNIESMERVKQRKEEERKGKEEEVLLETKVKEVRYRCEQINTSKINDITNYFAEQDTQFALKQLLSQHIAKVKLEEHIYNMSPAGLIPAFEFVSKTEFIKNNICFEISKENGVIEKISNIDEINSNWVRYRDTELEDCKYIRRIKQINRKGFEEIKKAGDLQFSSDNPQLEEEYRRCLFYFICFDAYLVKPITDIQPFNFLYLSTIVPPVTIPVEFSYKLISENNGIQRIRKVGKPMLNDELIGEIRKRYDEYHKAYIKYGFTEFRFKFNVDIEFNVKEKLVESARLQINEQIADNIEATCDFKLRKLNNYVK